MKSKKNEKMNSAESTKDTSTPSTPPPASYKKFFLENITND